MSIFAPKSPTTMTRITDLRELLRNMEPTLDEQTYVFATLPHADIDWAQIAQWNPVGTFREQEGLTLIVSQSVADSQGWNYYATFRLITLHVYSSLEAVGLTAAFATQLASCGISTNVIAAYHHDHIFVPADQATQAMEALDELRKG